MKSYFLLLVLSSVLLISCKGEVDSNETSNETNPLPAADTSEVVQVESDNDDLEEVPPPIMETVNPVQDVTHETFQNEDDSWGYKIYVDGSLYVNQPHIPAIQGKNGFKSQADAEQTASLVSDKVKNGISPPTVSKDELKELGVID